MTSHVLHINRHIAARPEQAFAAWRTSERVAQWFCPKPWRTTDCKVDFRNGGGITAVMEGPDGARSEHRSVFLEIVENERIVFTDAYVRAWEPSAAPFITAIVTLRDAQDGGTDYGVRVLHWSAADRERHERMGFIAGWNAVIDQLEALAAAL
jgi:uncharacterized protein YndB with AHSA1/START domain